MKLKKMVILMLLVATVMFGSFGSVTTVNAMESEIFEVEDVEFTKEQLADGVTFLLTKNAEGNFKKEVYYGAVASIPQQRALADGELEWASFHLGFVDWNDATGRLYFTISCDEPLYEVTGNAYVKSTSWLFPKNFYSDSFNEDLYGSTNTSRTLAEDVDTEDADKVRVGFSNVIFETIAGESGFFADASQIEER